MTSKNEWYVCGDIIAVDKRKRTVVLIVKGKVFRPKLFNVRGSISCVLTKEQYESLNIADTVEFTGHMVFGESNFLLVETVRNKIEMAFDNQSSKQFA